MRISKKRLKVETDFDPMKKQIFCIILNITGLHITPPPPAKYLNFFVSD